MNPLIQLKTTILLPLIVVVAVCFALAPVAEAVPPRRGEDRGNGNSAAENVSALNLGTTGSNNTAHGWFSLFSNTTGSSNTADGFQALYSNTEGLENTANGSAALYHNTIGIRNTANGFRALFSNTGNHNTAVGWEALAGNTFGQSNTAVGSGALSGDNTGGRNTAIGKGALSSNTTGTSNTAVGADALEFNTTGLVNTAIGGGALQFNIGGTGNTAVGSQALLHNIDGQDNIALGRQAGASLTTGNNNIDIGNSGLEGESNTIRIGREVHTATFIAGINGVNQGSPRAVFINLDTGQLGTTPPASSRRFKHEIKAMDNASKAILALKPVTFHYKSDKSGTPEFGLIAEEVAEVNPDLVVRDENGEIYTVRYDAVNAMLLNEFLNEHKTVQELKREIAALTATVKEQAAQIQKVSAQIEMNERASQTVAER